LPEDLEIPLLVDNSCTDKNVIVKGWLAQLPRFHLIYTPTYASWRNKDERRFRIIT
jgi:putative transposase